jgi:hypothetical protein
VGWDGDLEAELSETDSAASSSYGSAASDASVGVEWVDDRYAALQAWEEQERDAAVAAELGAGGLPTSVAADSLDATTASDANATAGQDAAINAARPGIRAEGQHGIPPYSPLFSRYRQSKQPGP